MRRSAARARRLLLFWFFSGVDQLAADVDGSGDDGGNGTDSSTASASRSKQRDRRGRRIAASRTLAVDVGATVTTDGWTDERIGVRDLARRDAGADRRADERRASRLVGRESGTRQLRPTDARSQGHLGRRAGACAASRRSAARSLSLPAQRALSPTHTARPPPGIVGASGDACAHLACAHLAVRCCATGTTPLFR